MLTRRSLLTTASLTALLAGCGGASTGGGVTPDPQLLDDVRAILTALQQASGLLPANAQGLIAQAEAIFGQLTAGGNAAQLVGAFVNIVQQVLPLLAFVPQLAPIVAAIQVLLPVIMAVVGLVTASKPTAGNVSQARATLRAYARRAG